MVHGEIQLAEIGLPGDGREQVRDEAGRERRDEGAERYADDDSNSQVDNIAAENRNVALSSQKQDRGPKADTSKPEIAGLTICII